MSDHRIPIVQLAGPGSQPPEIDETTLAYISLPTEMSKYQAPDLAPGALVAQTGAREALQWLEQALTVWNEASGPVVTDLGNIDDQSRIVLDQILGEGEVSVRYTGARKAISQESVLTGVWRTRYLGADDRIEQDLLEVGRVPHLVGLDLRSGTHPREHDSAADAGELMNALPLLTELSDGSARYRAGDNRVINLSLLPMTQADLTLLDQRLGRGALHLLSRSYGQCHVHSTALPNVWWVRYFNSMGTLILDTIELVDVPAVVCAAPEDLADSRLRLVALLEPYDEALRA